MGKLKITLELTLEEARFVISKLWQFRADKEEVNKVQPEPEPFMLNELERIRIPIRDGKGDAPEPQPFMLQYGKRYKRRDGRITAPLMESDSEFYPYTDGEELWKRDGSYHPLDNCYPLDLIEEA